MDGAQTEVDGFVSELGGLGELKGRRIQTFGTQVIKGLKEGKHGRQGRPGDGGEGQTHGAQGELKQC